MPLLQTNFLFLSILIHLLLPGLVYLLLWHLSYHLISSSWFVPLFLANIYQGVKIYTVWLTRAINGNFNFLLLTQPSSIVNDRGWEGHYKVMMLCLNLLHVGKKKYLSMS